MSQQVLCMMMGKLIILYLHVTTGVVHDDG
jgi:hypothetical protein